MDINMKNEALIILGGCGISILIVAVIMYFFPPKKINWLYGYRTTSSMSSQAKWDFAQRYSSILMIKCGIFLILFGLIANFFPFSKPWDVILVFPSVMVSIILLYYKTERAITKQFGKNKTHN